MSKYVVGDPVLSKMRPKEAVGNTVGDVEVLARAGNGHVKLKCLLCGGTFTTQWCKIKTGHTTSCGCKHRLNQPKQYVGKVFGELTVLNICVKKDTDGAVLAKFRCSCGDATVKRLNSVMRGKIRSCGHLGRSMGGLTVGENGRVYDIWRQMLLRCYKSGEFTTDKKLLKFLTGDREHARYKDYGKRGISVCKEWHDPIKFIKWYRDNVQPGESMDRIDNDGSYSPENVVSSGDSQQSRNQRLRKDNVTGYKGIMFTGSSYRWHIKHMGARHAMEGYSNADQALLERNLFIVATNKPHAVQTLLTLHKVIIHSKNEWHTLGIQYANRDMASGTANSHLTIYAKTSLEGDAGLKIMGEVAKRMKQAWVDKYDIQPGKT